MDQTRADVKTHDDPRDPELLASLSPEERRALQSVKAPSEEPRRRSGTTLNFVV
jgi:hypothetical protein